MNSLQSKKLENHLIEQNKYLDRLFYFEGVRLLKERPHVEFDKELKVYTDSCWWVFTHLN